MGKNHWKTLVGFFKCWGVHKPHLFVVNSSCLLLGPKFEVPANPGFGRSWRLGGLSLGHQAIGQFYASFDEYPVLRLPGAFPRYPVLKGFVLYLQLLYSHHWKLASAWQMMHVSEPPRAGYWTEKLTLSFHKYIYIYIYIELNIYMNMYNIFWDQIFDLPCSAGTIPRIFNIIKVGWQFYYIHSEHQICIWKTSPWWHYWNQLQTHL